MIAYFLLIIEVVFVITANILLKKGTESIKDLDLTISNIPSVIITAAKNPFIVLGLASYSVSFLMWIVVLSRLKLHLAYPISISLNVLFLTLASVFIFKESIAGLQIIGIATIILGIIVFFSSR